MRRYETLAHTADTGIVAFGLTLEEVFVNAAFGMFDSVFDLSTVAGTVQVAVEAEGETLDELLVAWLSALLAEAEIRGLAFSKFTADLSRAGRVAGSALGAPAAGQDLVGPPIKAVTFHDLAVERAAAGWQARVIFDV